MTPLDSPPSKPHPLLGARIRNIYSYRSPVVAYFLLKFSDFRCHGNTGWSETNFTYTFKFADPEKPCVVQEPDSPTHQTPFCSGFSQSSQNSFFCNNRHCNALTVDLHWCRQGTITFMIMIMIMINQEHTTHRSPVIANFLLQFSNFRYHGNRGRSETNFTYTVKFAEPEKPLLCAIIGAYLLYKSSYRKFCV